MKDEEAHRDVIGRLGHVCEQVQHNLYRKDRYENRRHSKVENRTATRYYNIAGSGLSRVIGEDGVDWSISPRNCVKYCDSFQPNDLGCNLLVP